MNRIPNNDYYKSKVAEFKLPNSDQLRSAVKPVEMLAKDEPTFSWSSILGLLVGAAAAVIVFWVFLILVLV